MLFCPVTHFLLLASPGHFQLLHLLAPCRVTPTEPEWILLALHCAYWVQFSHSLAVTWSHYHCILETYLFALSDLRTNCTKISIFQHGGRFLRRSFCIFDATPVATLTPLQAAAWTNRVPRLQRWRKKKILSATWQIFRMIKIYEGSTYGTQALILL